MRYKQLIPDPNLKVDIDNFNAQLQDVTEHFFYFNDT
jgi:hypothetical protein